MIRQAIPSIAAVVLAIGGLCAASTASAQSASSQATRQDERARCDGVQQDRAACLREIGAAREEARRNGLTSVGPNSYEQNAMARCGLQPASEQAECRARVTGSGPGRTAIEGSVMGGGVIRETVTPIPAPAR